MVSTEPQTCRLCRESRTLVESHILPEFLYKPTYDEGHSSIYLDVDSEQTGTRRRGFWEILFCEECEERFNRWETYFAEIWFNRSVRPPFSLARNRFIDDSGDRLSEVQALPSLHHLGGRDFQSAALPRRAPNRPATVLGLC